MRLACILFVGRSITDVRLDDDNGRPLFSPVAPCRSPRSAGLNGRKSGLPLSLSSRTSVMERPTNRLHSEAHGLSLRERRGQAHQEILRLAGRMFNSPWFQIRRCYTCARRWIAGASRKPSGRRSSRLQEGVPGFGSADLRMHLQNDFPKDWDKDMPVLKPRAGRLQRAPPPIRLYTNFRTGCPG